MSDEVCSATPQMSVFQQLAKVLHQIGDNTFKLPREFARKHLSIPEERLMGTINLEDIQAGMILEKDVVDRSGRILLGAGQKISEKNLRIFKMWGVTEADIQNISREEVSVKAAAQLDPVMLQHAEEQARDLFCHVDLKHPFNSELFRLVTFRMVNRRLRGAS